MIVSLLNTIIQNLSSVRSAMKSVMHKQVLVLKVSQASSFIAYSVGLAYCLLEILQPFCVLLSYTGNNAMANICELS